MFKIISILFLGLFFTHTSQAASPWSTEAHNDLIVSAFPDDRADCIERMKAGSAWVDSGINQLPSHSFMHAMRATNQSVDDAKDKMADYIQGEYEMVADLLASSTEVIYASPADPSAQLTPDQKLITNLDDYLSACEHRGRGLHPVMDSTSPAHEGFQIWSLLDIADIFRHGDFSGSIENQQALIENPDVKTKTVGLMQVVQKIYVDLGMEDFRFE